MSQYCNCVKFKGKYKVNMILKLVFAFGAGFISFLTPCVLPIIPGYIQVLLVKIWGKLTKINQ